MQFAAGGRQIAPTLTFIDFKEQEEENMEVEFAARGQQIAPTVTCIDLFYGNRPSSTSTSLFQAVISVSRSLFQVTSIDVTINTPDLCLASLGQQNKSSNLCFFPEWYSPGGQIVPTPNASILPTPREHQVPYRAQIDF